MSDCAPTAILAALVVILVMILCWKARPSHASFASAASTLDLAESPRSLRTDVNVGHRAEMEDRAAHSALLPHAMRREGLETTGLDARSPLTVDADLRADDPRGDPAVDAPERRSVYAALGRLYSTADVDALVTGHLYEFSDGIRNVYAQRTSHGDVRGLTEYSSAGGVGDVGVDIGPYGLDEYGGREFGFDDGIPEPWKLPSTPVRWYAPAKRDYYGEEGATPYAAGVYTLTEPDHDPLMP